MIPNLIFDVGFHEACDTEFYLRKGFRVVAIDANPMLCEKARERLVDYIESGRLHILNFGISESDKVEDFIINFDKSDWSSFVPTFGHRTGNTKIVPVQCKPLDYFLEMFGTPYYLKVDIEGYDYTCVAALQGRSSLPKFVSVEATVEDFPDRMRSLGYQRFKLINQMWHTRIPLRSPPIEGTFVQQQMTGHHSGPFGDETYGSWLTYEEVIAEWQHVKERRYAGSYHERIGCREDDFVNSWWDFHCSLGSPDDAAKAGSATDIMGEPLADAASGPALHAAQPASPARTSTLSAVLGALETAHQGELAALRVHLAQSHEQIDAFKQQADQAAAARMATELRLAELTGRLHEAKQQHDDAQATIAQLREELQDRELRQARATAARVATESRVKELNDGLREAHLQRDAAQAAITQLQRELQDRALREARRRWWRLWNRDLA